MEIIDGQLHEPGLQSFWDDQDQAIQNHAISDALEAMIRAVGVDGAVLHPIEDVGWAHYLAQQAPGRFTVVPMIAPRLPRVRRWTSIDPERSELPERLAEAAGRPGFSAFRVIPMAHVDRIAEPDAGYEAAFEFCSRRSIPVFLSTPGRPDIVERVVQGFPELTLILNHMGLTANPGAEADPWGGLPGVISLARHQRINLKLSGLPALSAVGEPFGDLGDHLRAVLDAYGAERCMWASDICFYQGQIGWANRFPKLIRPYPGKHTYAQSVRLIQEAPWLDAAEKRLVLGGTARRILHWSETPADSAAGG